LRNLILVDLPADLLDLLRPDMRRVTLVSGHVLYERDDPIEEVYFIDSGLASLTAETFDNGQVEVGMVGREGFVGAAAMLFPQPLSAQRAFMQVPGEALRLSRVALLAAVETAPLLRTRCLAAVGAMMQQTAQTAACNARHDVTERLARWLLMSHDRVDGDVLPLTQEFLSYMLGVRRPGVAVSAGALQADGLIQYARGRITVVDRPGLEAAACGCYRLLRLAEAKQADADRPGTAPDATPSHTATSAGNSHDESTRADDNS
jgi:CRP-like cAMP-binding protein